MKFSVSYYNTGQYAPIYHDVINILKYVTGPVKVNHVGASYIVMNIFHSKMSIYVLPVNINSTLVILIFFNLCKQIISYESKVKKSRQFLCAHMVDFAGPVTYVIIFY